MAFLHVSEVLLAGAGSLRAEAGAVWVKMAVVEECLGKGQVWRLENSVSCGLHATLCRSGCVCVFSLGTYPTDPCCAGVGKTAVETDPAD